MSRRGPIAGQAPFPPLAVSATPIAATLLLAAALALSGCDRLGLDDPAKIAAVKEAEGKAIGAGCRHAGRSLEECYGMNGKAQKAAVFAGWREMNDYMASNNIPTAAPLAQAPVAPAAAAPARDAVAANLPKSAPAAANAAH
jgi:hypothetical protein